MTRIFMTLLEVLAAVPVLFLVFLLLHGTRFHNFRKTACYFLFACYLAAVYVLVGLPNVTYIRFGLKLNWIPFAGILADLKNSLLNVLLFVPLGLALPLFWDSYRHFWKTTGFGFVMSLGIEVLQMFTYRATDVNDLLMNTLGTALGFWMAAALLWLRPSLRLYLGKSAGWELWLICLVVFLTMFFAHPYLVPFLY